MFNLKGFALFILTVTMVTKSALAQCSDTRPEYGFPDCGPIDFPQRYSMCCLRGDPHVITFDELLYNVNGEGWYAAVYSDGLQIDVYIGKRDRRSDQYRVTGVKITKNGKTYQVKFNRKEKIVEVTGEENPVNIPFKDDHLSIWTVPDTVVALFSRRVIIRCAEFRIVINCKFHLVYIYLSKEWSSQVYGLCGYLNGDKGDDTNCQNNCVEDFDDDRSCPDSSSNEPCTVDDFRDLWEVKHEEDTATIDDDDDDDNDDGRK